MFRALSSEPHRVGIGPIRLPASAVATARSLAQRVARGRQVDFWVREIDPTWSLSTLRARVVDVIDETHDLRTFVLAPNRLWPGHRAGQFVEVEVEIDGVRVSRCYSLSSASSAPGDNHVAITVKRVPGGRVSSWMHDHVGRGEVVRLGMPAGDFVLGPGAPRKRLFLSGGSGVTPVMSILRDMAQKNLVGDLVFVHAARSKNDVPFALEIARLAARHRGLRVVYFLEDDAARGGRVDSPKLLATVPDLVERSTMLCGPSGMMDALSPMWTKMGIAHRLKTERFAPPSRPALPSSGAPEKVKLTLLRSGKTVVTPTSDTLLEELERAGETPANGCRMGICNTCMCRKRSGVVEDILTGALSSEPDCDIRLCVSRARTDLELAL